MGVRIKIGENLVFGYPATKNIERLGNHSLLVEQFYPDIFSEELERHPRIRAIVVAEVRPVLESGIMSDPAFKGNGLELPGPRRQTG